MSYATYIHFAPMIKKARYLIAPMIKKARYLILIMISNLI